MPPYAARPDQVAGLSVWLKADSITGKSDNDPVESWFDQAGGHHFSQGNVSKRPTYQTNEINGLPCVRYDGVDDALSTIYALFPPATFFFVTKPNTEPMMADSEAGLIFGQTTNWKLYAGSTLTGPAHGTSWQNLRAVSSGVAGTSNLSIDGAAGTTGNASTGGAGTSTFFLGGSSTIFGGQDIAEVIVYNRLLTPNEIALVDSYIEDKYGIPQADSGSFDDAAYRSLFGQKTGGHRGRTDVQRFTASGTWVKPEGAKACEVIVVAGGGSGGAGRRGAAASVRVGGGAGAGAAMSRHLFVAADLASTVAVTVGAGAVGATGVTVDNTSGTNGGPGGTSSFGTYLRATAGGAGSGGGTANGSSNPGGSVGTDLGTGSGTPTTTGSQPGGSSITYLGAGGAGTGGTISSADVVTAGGLGGNLAIGPLSGPQGTAGAAGGGAGGDGPTVGLVGGGAGGGGASATTNAGNGGNGGFPGGGGGGGGASLNGFNSGAGGNGAPGIVVVMSYL